MALVDANRSGSINYLEFVSAFKVSDAGSESFKDHAPVWRSDSPASADSTLTGLSSTVVMLTFIALLGLLQGAPRAHLPGRALLLALLQRTTTSKDGPGNAVSLNR
jgi:hypothetical protein